MVQSALPVPLAVKLRVMVKAVLDSAADYSAREYLPVSLGQNQAVDASRLAFAGGTVVFGGLRDLFYLLIREPFTQPPVGTYYPA